MGSVCLFFVWRTVCGVRQLRCSRIAEEASFTMALVDSQQRVEMNNLSETKEEQSASSSSAETDRCSGADLLLSLSKAASQVGELPVSSTTSRKQVTPSPNMMMERQQQAEGRVQMSVLSGGNVKASPIRTKNSPQMDHQQQQQQQHYAYQQQQHSVAPWAAAGADPAYMYHPHHPYMMHSPYIPHPVGSLPAATAEPEIVESKKRVVSDSSLEDAVASDNKRSRILSNQRNGSPDNSTNSNSRQGTPQPIISPTSSNEGNHQQDTTTAAVVEDDRTPPAYYPPHHMPPHMYHGCPPPYMPPHYPPPPYGPGAAPYSPYPPHAHPYYPPPPYPPANHSTGSNPATTTATPPTAPAATPSPRHRKTPSPTMSSGNKNPMDELVAAASNTHRCVPLKRPLPTKCWK